RTISMIEKYNGGIVPSPNVSTEFDQNLIEMISSMPHKVDEAMDNLQYSEAFECIWKVIRRSNKYIDETAPWNLAKDQENKGILDTVLYNLYESLRVVGVMISPMLHKTADKMFEQLNVANEYRTYESRRFGCNEKNVKVTKGEMLFPRLDIEKELEFLEDLFSPKNEVVKEIPVVHKDEITIDDFEKIELKTAKVLECEKHPKAEKLLVFKLQVGNETRQIVSGIANYYKPEELIDKTLVVVLNLKPVKLRGVISEGMILSAANSDETVLKVLSLDGLEDGWEVK
ncbi:MAG: methionine--tRNA ligase subunit beta, partial [Filifactoraceae bacterium]